MSSSCLRLALVGFTAVRGARVHIEEALGPDVARWPWSPRVSLWLDSLLQVEEGDS